jgi:hypothetical protein
MIEILLAFTLYKLEAHWGWWAVFSAGLLLKYWQFIFVMVDVFRKLGP